MTPNVRLSLNYCSSLDYARRKLVVTTSRTKRSADFIAHLRLLDRLYGPKARRAFKPVVLVLDNGPIHVSKATLAALAERAHWLVVEWLPKYTPELNDIEVVWGDLKARHLAHQTFTDPGRLDKTIHCAVAALNSERTPIRWPAKNSATKTQPRAVASCGLGRALKRDVIAEALKPALQVCDGAGLTDLVEIGFSEVAVRQPFGEHVIGADENSCGQWRGPRAWRRGGP